MRNYKIGIIILGIFVGLVIVTGFSIIGSPAAQTGIRYDETRYSDFQQIKNRIEQYYQNNNSLPGNLSDLGQNNVNITDPETKQPYDYTILEGVRYQLCATFSTNSEEFNNLSGAKYFDFPVNHKLGYSCVTFGLPDYIK